MQLDPEYLRRHYSSLSDEALMAIDRADLVEMARRIYDAEVQQRELSRSHSPRARSVRADDGEREPRDAPRQSEAEPDWIEDAAEMYSQFVRRSLDPPERMLEDRDILEAAGMPCYLELSSVPEEEKDSSPPPTHVWRLLVPGEVTLRATNILERDRLNQEYDAQWRMYLETLSDNELLNTSPEEILCGLFDRVERAHKAYAEEIARRGL